jgi:addiction module HigA family antidote
MTMHSPPHPGAFIRDEILDANDLTVTAAAGVLGVGRPALSNLLNSRADLSPEMALRIEKAFGIRMDTLMEMQLKYDLAIMRRASSKIRVKRFHPVAA